MTKTNPVNVGCPENVSEEDGGGAEVEEMVAEAAGIGASDL
jgi:hypothetical protein